MAWRAAPVVLPALGLCLVVIGAHMRPEAHGGYVSPHPWADAVTAGAVLLAVGTFEGARRVARARSFGGGVVVAGGAVVAVAAALLVGVAVFGGAR